MFLIIVGVPLDRGVKPLELKQLRSFAVVAKFGSLTKAARSLGLPESTLSRRIQDLEGELGVALFERAPQGLRLTQAGERSLADARRLIGVSEGTAPRTAPHRRAGTSGLYVGYGGLLADWQSVSEIFHGFRLVYPSVPLRAVAMGRTEMKSALDDRRIDAGLIGVMTWPARGYDGTRLYMAPQTGVLLSSTHPLASRRILRVADLQPLTWFHLRSEATWGAHEGIRDALRRRGFNASGISRPENKAFLPRIAAGEGWALADEALGRTLSALTSEIVFRPFADPPIDIWVAALWRKGERNDRRDALVQVARKLLDSRSRAGGDAFSRIAATG